MSFSVIKTLEEALKTIYLDPLIKMIDEESGPVMAAIEKTSEHLVGDQIRFAVQYGRHGGIGARGESDPLPDASPRNYKSGVTGTKNLFARINFSEKLMLISKNSKATFVDEVSTQMEDITTDAKDMMRRNLLGRSDGIMGTVAGAVTSGTVVGINGNIKKFYPGQSVDIFKLAGNNSQTKEVSGGIISDVDIVEGTISFANAVTCSANSYITLKDNFMNELTGLGEIMGVDNILYGIDRSKHKWYNPQVFNLEGAPFSSMYIQEAIDSTEDLVAAKPDFICCDATVRRAYIAEQEAYKRNLEYKNIDGGHRLISYNDIAITKEKYMPEGTIYLLDTNQLKLVQVSDWSWMDDDGNILSRVPNYAAYEATLTKYCDLICKKPAAFAEIVNIGV